VTTCHVVDSSGWLEYFIDSERASLFASAIEDPENLIVPVITVYEVCKKVLRERGEHDALQIASVMQQGRVIDVDNSLIMEAMRLSLPLADSLIYATSQRYGAVLLTQDEHFKAQPGVRYFEKKKRQA
jgi:toxin FitB